MRTAASITVVVVGALLGFATFAAEPDQSHLMIAVARVDGTYETFPFGTSDLDLRNAKHLWAWTERLPPRKFDVATMPRQRQAVIEQLERGHTRLLDIRLRGWSRTEELASVRVIVAPEEMWTSVPESLLPTFPVTREGRSTISVRDSRTRARAIGKNLGSAWEHVGSTVRAVELALRPSSDVELTLLSTEGSPLSRAFATVMSARRGDAEVLQQAQYAGDARGRLRMQSLPNVDVIAVVLTAEGAAPRTIVGAPAELNRTIELAAAGEIRGTFVDESDEPLKGIKLLAEAWIAADAPAMSQGSGLSDEQGRWSVGGLPRTRAVVRASARGRGTFQREVSLEDGNIDLGTITLQPSSDVKLAVVDDEHQPIAKAVVTTDSGFKGETAADGAVAISGLSPDGPASVILTARGFVKQTIVLTPPFPKENEIVLDRAFSVTGSVVDDAGAPPEDTSITVTTGANYRRLNVSADGTFAFDMDAGREFDLAFESPSAASVTRTEAAGRAGEVRDLGAIRLPAGMIVRGRITDSEGAAIVGARVWVIRPSAAGTVASWVAGRVVRTTSDAEGAFELRGVPAGPALVRVDIPDFARAHRNVVVDQSLVDLGVIELVRGSVVTVRTRDEGTARLDLRGDWIDADMLTAPVLNGEARLRNVPPGEYRVTVLGGHAVTCERRVAVREGADASVECPPPMIVRGRVLLDGAPAYTGTLAWSQPSGTDALIDTKLSAMGARQQRVYGMANGTVTLPVLPDGSFETQQLRSGDWQVSWRSGDSAGTSNRPIHLPDVAEAHIVVEFAGGLVRGRVLDSDGRAIAGARIREIQGPLFAMAADDGSFTLTAVPAGLHHLLAALEAKTSRIMDVTVEPGKQMPDVTFVLEDKRRNVLSVHVIGPDGEPKPNAIVFIQAAGIIRTLTADAQGVASAAFPEGLPEGARIVAFADAAWAFGQLQRSGGEDDAQSAAIRFGRTGTLKISSRTRSGAPSVASPRAGDLSWMLGRIGSMLTLTPSSPVVVHGLPPGLYDVRLDAAIVTASVSAGTVATVELP